jgi:hypothetical protein
MKLKRLTLFIVSFLHLNLNASILYSGGTYVSYFNEVQTNTSGGTRSFAITPYLGIGSPLPLTSEIFFIPELGYVYYTDSATDLKKETVMLHYNFTYAFTDQFHLRYGLTTNWYKLKGEGGKQRLKNGNGYSDFDSPDSTVTTYFTTFDIGLELFFQQGNSFRFDFQIMNAKEFEERQYNYLLTFNFYR